MRFITFKDPDAIGAEQAAPAAQPTALVPPTSDTPVRDFLARNSTPLFVLGGAILAFTAFDQINFFRRKT